MPNALIIGSSDGIGLAVARRLLARGWTVAGLSRSPLPAERLAAPTGTEIRYRHIVSDVCNTDYRARLEQTIDDLGTVDVCIYCAGIGEPLDLDPPERVRATLDRERAVFQTNLVGAVDTIAVVLPRMLAAGHGHIVGLSSQADVLRDPGAPSHTASKAGFSAYLEGLALAVRRRGVHVTNVRFGFVDTKLSASVHRPFLISADKAAALVLRCLDRRPIRFTRPRRMAALLWLVSWPNRLRTCLS